MDAKWTGNLTVALWVLMAVVVTLLLRFQMMR